MSSNKKIYGIAMISKIAITLLGLVTSALINRMLGVELKGEYAYIINCVTITLAVLSIGLGQTYSTYRRKYGREILGTFVGLSLIQTLITLIIFIIAFISKANFYICAVGLLSILSVLKNNILYLAAIEDIKKRDTNNIKYKIIYAIVVTIAYICGMKSLEKMLCIYILEDTIIVIGTFLSYKFRPSFKFLKENHISVLKIYKYGFLSMLMLLMMTLNYNLNTIFLKNMASSRSVGLYSVAVSLANMLWLIPDAFKDVLFNKTSKKDSIQEIVTVTKYSIYFSTMVVIGFAILGKPFIRIMYGEEFLDSYGVTLIMFVGCISMVIYKLIHPLYIAKGKQWKIFCILTLSVITNIIMNSFMIYKFDIYGAAMTAVFAYSICSVIFLVNFCRDYNIKYREFILINKQDIQRIKDIRTFIKNKMFKARN